VAFFIKVGKGGKTEGRRQNQNIAKEKPCPFKKGQGFFMNDNDLISRKSILTCIFYYLQL